MLKVTVLMAVYNGELYLQESIDSILTQTFNDFELLIINDGSTDRTREIICSYNDLRIRLIDNEQNMGLTKSLNKGWQLAQGEFIARQDADDISEPERLAKQVDFLEKQPEVALVGTWYKNIDSESNLIGEYPLPSNSTEIRWETLFCSPFIHSAVMFRNHLILEKVGLYDEAFSYAQDYELWSRITRRFKVANIKEHLINLRLNPSSMTATYGNIVENEPLLIQITNLEHLLGPDKAKKWNDGELIKAMSSLWLAYSDPDYIPDYIKVLNLQRLDETIENMFYLHHAFCPYYSLNKQERKQHHNEVSTYLSEKLLDLTNYYLKKDKYTTWQLFIRTCRLKLSILRQPSTLDLLYKFIRGSRLKQKFQYLVSQKLKKKNQK